MIQSTNPRRKSIRLEGYDYSKPGGYFVTICTRSKEDFFGEIKNEVFLPNRLGKIVQESWIWLEKRYAYIELDAWVLMPNHLHGIILIHGDHATDETCRGGARAAPPKPHKGKPLGQLVGAFKTKSTKQINQLQGTPGKSLWQRGYYDRIIRNEQELDRIRCYIQENPLKWELDPYHVG
jgi:putative transposase